MKMTILKSFLICTMNKFLFADRMTRTKLTPHCFNLIPASTPCGNNNHKRKEIMKKLFGKVRYSVSDDGLTASIFAPLKSSGKMAAIGFVHSGAVQFMKTKADFEKHGHLIRLKP